MLTFSKIYQIREKKELSNLTEKWKFNNLPKKSKSINGVHLMDPYIIKAKNFTFLEYQKSIKKYSNYCIVVDSKNM